MRPHREPEFTESLHNEFATNDKQNIDKDFIPHPPNSLVKAKVDHFDKGIPSFFL